MSNEFLEALPDDILVPFKDDKGAETQIKLKEHPSALKFKDAPSVLKSYIEAEKSLSGRVAVPTDKSTPEERSAFWNKLGRPEKADGYKLTELKDLHPSIKLGPEGAKPYLEMAHSLNITNEAADKLHSWFLKQMSEAAKVSEKTALEAQAASKAALEKEWGGKLAENLEASKKFVELVGGKDAVDALGDMGNNPALLKMLHKISTVISEDAIQKINGGQGGGGGSNTAEGAKQAIDAVINLRGEERAKHPYFNENDPKHQEAVNEMREKYKLAYSEKSE